MAKVKAQNAFPVPAPTLTVLDVPSTEPVGLDRICRGARSHIGNGCQICYSFLAESDWASSAIPGR